MRVHRHKHAYQTVTNLAPHPLHSHPCMMASQTYLCGQHRRNQERPRRLARRKPRHTLAQPAAPGCSMPAYNPRIIRASCNVKAMTEYGYCVYSHVHAHAYAGGRDSCRFAPLRLHRGPASIEAPGEIDVGVQRRFHMQHTPPNMFMNSCNQMSLSCVCARERDRRIDRETDRDRESETDREVMNTQARAHAHTHTHTHTHTQAAHRPHEDRGSSETKLAFSAHQLLGARTHQRATPGGHHAEQAGTPKNGAGEEYTPLEAFRPAPYNAASGFSGAPLRRCPCIWDFEWISEWLHGCMTAFMCARARTHVCDVRVCDDARECACVRSSATMLAGHWRVRAKQMAKPNSEACDRSSRSWSANRAVTSFSPGLSTADVAPTCPASLPPPK